MDKIISLDRNKITKIGIKTATLTALLANRAYNSWEVYKGIKRGNKVFLYTIKKDRLELKFKFEKSAEKFKEQLKGYLNE